MKKYDKNTYIENGYLSASKKTENSFIDTHFHNFYEMEFIISGKGTYTVDGIEYNIESGDLFFLTPLDFHYVDIKDAELYNVMFSGDICNQDFLLRLTRNSPVFLKTSDDSKQFFEVMLNELCSDTSTKEYSIALLDAIIAKLNIETQNNESLKDDSVINIAELYIMNNFRNELTLNDAAKHVSLSPTYFSRLFKEKKGINFKTYLNNMRFEYAKNLLKSTDMTIMQVCIECGFNDYPNFIRRFRQYSGDYPAQYRNKKSSS